MGEPSEKLRNAICERDELNARITELGGSVLDCDEVLSAFEDAINELEEVEGYWVNHPSILKYHAVLERNS